MNSIRWDYLDKRDAVIRALQDYPLVCARAEAMGLTDLADAEDWEGRFGPAAPPAFRAKLGTCAESLAAEHTLPEDSGDAEEAAPALPKKRGPRPSAEGGPKKPVRYRKLDRSLGAAVARGLEQRRRAGEEEAAASAAEAFPSQETEAAEAVLLPGGKAGMGKGSPSGTAAAEVLPPDLDTDGILRCRTEEYLRWFEPVWRTLSNEERFLLQVFYMTPSDRRPAALNAACALEGIELPSLYRRKNRILLRLVRALYG